MHGEAEKNGVAKQYVFDRYVLLGVGTIILFGMVIVGVAFWIVIGQNFFLRDEVSAQTDAQICRSEARSEVDQAVAGAIAALSNQVSVISDAILLTDPEGRDELLAKLDKTNQSLRAATDALTATTEAQASLVEACNEASAEGQSVDTTDSVVPSTEGE